MSTTINSDVTGTIRCLNCQFPILTFDVAALRNKRATDVIESSVFRYIHRNRGPEPYTNMNCPNCGANYHQAIATAWRELKKEPREWDEVTN